MEIKRVSGNLIVPVERDDYRAIAVLSVIEGRRRWLKAGALSLEDTPLNRAAVLRAFPRAFLGIAPLASGPGTGGPGGGLSYPSRAEGTTASERVGASSKASRKRADYRQKTRAFAHQTRALAKARKAYSMRLASDPNSGSAFALFMEQGTGKTKVALDWAGELYASGEIDACLVISKKGPHAQWATEQIPEHYGATCNVDYWTGKKQPLSSGIKEGIHFFCINVDALKHDKGWDAAIEFVRLYGRRILVVIDESQTIKTHTSKRTKRCYQIGELVNHRMILTGTPIAKDISDEWSQFKFLDESIIGYRYLTSFRHQYCIMGGFEMRQVVGTKNMDEFLAKVEPYNFRVTKEEELDLPPKQYVPVAFEMADEQRKHFDSLKENYITMLESGEVATVANAAVLVTRLQQVTCGVIEGGEDGGRQELQNPRLDALLELLEQREGKAVIWARFNYDIEKIAEALGRRCVTYYGKTGAKEREDAKRRWLDRDSGVDYLVANPAAGGTGLNLQGDCRTVIYYSNSFNAIDRWQSEDRTHRIGTHHTVTYFDLICRGSPDRKILANLRNKKSISDLALGDIKKLIDDEVDDAPSFVREGQKVGGSKVNYRKGEARSR